MTPPTAHRWTVYLVRCADDSLYCGITTEVTRRVQAHNAGTGAKYTAGRRPVTLVYTEGGYTYSEALQREYHIKQLSKHAKEALITCSHS